MFDGAVVRSVTGEAVGVGKAGSEAGFAPPANNPNPEESLPTKRENLDAFKGAEGAAAE